jgi:2'-5' RNA ligase
MYFIALVLPPHLNEKVLKLKEMMLEKYKCKVALKSPAHITLVPPFWMDELKEEDLLKDVDGICSRLNSFELGTKDFSAFKPKTIFIALAPNEMLNEVKKATDDFFINNTQYAIKAGERPFHPHITIATRDLFKKDFHEIWPWFAEKKFGETWRAEGISVLRHNKKNWDVIHTSQFLNSKSVMT